MFRAPLMCKIQGHTSHSAVLGPSLRLVLLKPKQRNGVFSVLKVANLLVLKLISIKLRKLRILQILLWSEVLEWFLDIAALISWMSFQSLRFACSMEYTLKRMRFQKIAQRKPIQGRSMKTQGKLCLKIKTYPSNLGLALGISIGIMTKRCDPVNKLCCSFWRLQLSTVT